MGVSRERGTPCANCIACEEPLARAAATLQLRHWHRDLPDALDLLRARAKDQDGLVRMEAVIAASYLGTAGALDAILPVLEAPADDHLTYAIRTSLDSEALSRHWKGNAAYLAAHPQIEAFQGRQVAAAKAAARKQVRSRARRNRRSTGRPTS